MSHSTLAVCLATSGTVGEQFMKLWGKIYSCFFFCNQYTTLARTRHFAPSWLSPARLERPACG
eukprot:1945466-Karenia_brevis.AAC.1